MPKDTKNKYGQKIEFVEKLSLLYEEQGHPRISGQILGWLHVCEPPEQSFSDLVENLQVSKASISNMTRLLIQGGLIERVRKQGERQIHFRLVDNIWCNFMEKRLEFLFSMRKLSALYIDEGGENEDLQRVREMHEFYKFASGTIPKLIEEYRKE